jgi:hypothetical protein
MKRSLSGLLPLAMILALGSCTGDPTGDIRNLARIDATPTAMIINVGSAETVDLQIIDQQGNPRAGNLSFSIANPAVVSVEVDTTYRPGLGSEALTRRYVITALQADTTSVIFSSGGLNRRIGILANPLNFPGVFVGSPGNINDLVTVTAAGFKFPPGTRVQFGGNEQLVTAIAADSNSVTFRAGNLGGGPVTVIGLTLASVTSTALTLSSDANITIGPGITSLTGTDARATAPQVPAPPAGGSVVLVDAGAYNASADCAAAGFGFPCRVYRVEIVEDGDYVTTTTWNNVADLGLYITDAAGAVVAADDNLGPGSNTEGPGTHHLSPGTHYFHVVSFATGYPPPNNVDPTEHSITITH